MKGILITALLVLTSGAALADIVISGNENKIDLSSGEARVVENPAPDTLTILDFSVMPPRVNHIDGVRNSVLGPPTNIAITPDEKLALIASSVQIDPKDKAKYVPDNIVHILDLELEPPAVIGRVTVGKQPSGMSINRDGTLALVANRAEGTVSVLSIQGKQAKNVQTVQIGEPTDEVCDVAFSPDGTHALVTNRTKHQVELLEIDGATVRTTGQSFTAYGRVYHCQITPDGKLGLAAGDGFGHGAGAITVINLEGHPIEIIDVVLLGTAPESFDISPDGKLVAAVLMNYSNVPSDHPQRTENGKVVLLKREGKKLTKVQEFLTGRIPEGVIFSPDGRFLLVQCHPAREIAVYAVEGQSLEDSGLRIKVPGMPSSLRAAENR